MKMFTKSRSIFFLAALSVTFACKKNSSEPEATPTTLTLAATSTTVYAGAAVQLTATVTYSDGASADVSSEVSWSLASGDKGDISAAGLFTAWSDVLGFETVTAFYKGLTAEKMIEITPRAVTLSSWPVIVTVGQGESQQFEVTAQFHDVSAAFVTEEVSWALRPGLAGSITADGLFQPHSGMTGAETLSVTYQALQVESFIRVTAAPEPPFALTTIPAGTFIMGDDNGPANERPAHQVTLSSFAIGTHEVTNEEFVRFLNDANQAGEITYSSGVIAAKKGPYAGFVYAKNLGSVQFPQQYIVFVDNSGGGMFEVVAGFEKYPALRINWYGAMAFCGFYGFRLPTEAEWEMACRGGLQYIYGTETGTLDHDLANYEGFGGRDRFVGPAPVGSFPANPFGLFDMSGNVSEYVFDVYQADYYANSPGIDPRGPGPTKVLGQLPGGLAIWRGGAWIHGEQTLRASTRGIIFDQADNSLLAQSTVGFRVAKSLQ